MSVATVIGVSQIAAARNNVTSSATPQSSALSSEI